MRQGPLWIVEPPLSTGEQMSVNDPMRPVALWKAAIRGLRRTAQERPFIRFAESVVSPRDERLEEQYEAGTVGGGYSNELTSSFQNGGPAAAASARADCQSGLTIAVGCENG